MSEPAPDPNGLSQQSNRFDVAAKKLGAWIASKADLAVDELIKNSIKALSWASALGALGGIAAGLKKLAQMLTGG